MLVMTTKKAYFIQDLNTYTKKEKAKAILFDGANSKDFTYLLTFDGIEFYYNAKQKRKIQK